jgi:molybdopterin-containing oxidoreductase family membrane subunit
MRLQRRLLGVFDNPHDAADAAQALQKEKHCAIEVFSPVPEHHLLDVAPPRWKPVRYFTLAGGLLGLAGGFTLAIWTASLHGLWLSGMPPVAPIPFVIIGFEVTVLLGGLATLLGLLIGTRLPRLVAPPLWDNRLSEDHFGIGVDCRKDNVDYCARLCEQHGAKDVHRA